MYPFSRPRPPPHQSLLQFSIGSYYVTGDELGKKKCASNVFCILTHAQKFGGKSLEDRCWEVIERRTEEAATSDEFVSVVECVVKREKY